MNFEISASDITLLDLNVRSENHGDEHVPAIDLKLTWTTANDALSLFDPGLARFIYGPETRQQSVEGVGPRTMRAFPSLGPLKWEDEVTGLKLTIEPGISGKSAIILPDCSADRFVIDPLDGGSVQITFRVRCVCSDERTLGKLALLVKHELPMQIERQNELRPGDVVPIAAGTGRKGKKATGPTPEEAFMGTT